MTCPCHQCWQAYLDALTGVLGRPERQAGLRAYCTGLLLPGGRKSIEPIAARLGAERQSARHQALHHFVTQARWSDEALLDAVAHQVLPAIERHGPITAWIVDDTDAHPAGVGGEMVDAVRHDLAQILVGEVVDVDPALPAHGAVVAAAVAEIADQFLLFGVHRDHRLAGGQSGQHARVDVLELGIAAGVVGAVVGLAVGLPTCASSERTLLALSVCPSAPSATANLAWFFDTQNSGRIGSPSVSGSTRRRRSSSSVGRRSVSGRRPLPGRRSRPVGNGG